MKTSKSIGKNDEGAKKLVIRALNCDTDNGFGHDSVYFVNGRYRIYMFFELTEPVEKIKLYDLFSDPNELLMTYDSARRMNAQLFIVAIDKQSGTVYSYEITEHDSKEYNSLLIGGAKGEALIGTFHGMLTKSTLKEYSETFRKMNGSAGFPPPADKPREFFADLKALSKQLDL